MNILLVKLSSLGDVLHNLPVVWDLRARFPDAHIDWVVEEGYVQLLEPLRQLDDAAGLDRIIPVALRRWRRTLGSSHWGNTKAEWHQFRRSLAQRRYDIIIETQGLIKSAIVTRLAARAPRGIIAGLANRTEYSGYEPLARLFYNRSVHVPAQCHAVDRSRLVAAAAVDAAAPHRQAAPPRFYPRHFLSSLATQDFVRGPYALCFHATARAAKQWDEANWIALGKHLSAHHLVPVFPWGSAAEKSTSERLARAVPGAVVPSPFSLTQAFGIVAGAQLTVGVDTGLTHLAAILGTPTIELYCDSPRWKTEGYWGESIRNLGDRGVSPALDPVLQAVTQLLNGREPAI